ncbi:MAG: IS701 family transposase [Oscillospiraceae bacterium]|nr:IS701 family transposase [Oscillospiraceae bacterium]
MTFQLDKTPLEGELNEFGSTRLLKVDETKWEVFWNEIVNEYHYLRYEGQIGARIKYLIVLGEQIVGAISFCSGVYKLGPRDDYIGWDDSTRISKLSHILTNNRFLILPWIHIRNLASHVLSKALIQVREDWQKQYEVTPYIVETFVDREKYLGTCYIAANWTYLGVTKGYGRQGNSFVYHGNKKDIYVYIMSNAFAREFRPDLRRLSNGREELEDMINGIPLWTPTILKEMGIVGDFTEQIRQLFADHLSRYIGYVGSKENRSHYIAMEKGFLSNLERKSTEPIAIAFEGTEQARNLMNFMSVNKWDDIGMHDEYRKEVSELLTHKNGMITIDGSDFLKKGNESVGVYRQYCGRLDKVDNCQAGVFCGYVGPNGYALIDYELYIPEEWFGEEYASRLKKCKVPSWIGFKKKGQIASAQIRKAYDSGLFAAKYVGADSFFGNDSGFLNSLPKGLVYFVDIKSNCLVFTQPPELSIPSYSGKGRKPIKEIPDISPRTVKEIAQDESLPWNDVVLDIGAKGPIITRDKYLRVVESHEGLPGESVWLYIRELADGTMKYALCNESQDASAEDLRRPALMRWSIEQCFHECKKYLGMDHYESRSWNAWNRHMLLCILAHLFVIKLRMEFECNQQSPLVTPLNEEPVILEDFLDAKMSMISNESIKHPSITDVILSYNKS